MTRRHAVGSSQDGFMGENVASRREARTRAHKRARQMAVRRACVIRDAPPGNALSSAAERLGAALTGRYVVVREIGAGGMATVYLAHDARHDRHVAIKVLHPDLAATLGVDRFLSEIRTTARLQHPHLLPLLESGEADGLLYYVMPFVEGESLRARLERERQLPIADAVRIAREVAGALDYAHRQGVIHRDIKPENILLHEGQALVADFGIALAVSAAGGGRLTQTGLSLGTPQYMAPEQAMGEKQIDHRADIYALGAVTYEMLAGEPPFTGPTVQAIVARIMTDRVRSLTSQRPSVPAHVEAAVLTALEKLPADRFGSAAELGAALAGEGTIPMPRAAEPTPAVVRSATPWRAIAIGAIGVALLSAGYALSRSSLPAEAAAGRVVRFRIALPPAEERAALRISIAPRGDVVAWTDDRPGAEAGIHVRRLNDADAALLPGTADALTHGFSPDGASLAFVTSGSLLRVLPRSGGAPVTLARGVDWYGGIDWAEDGYVYFTSVDSGVVSRVLASGGVPERLGTLDSTGTTQGFRAQNLPRLLPDRRGVIFSVYRGPGREHDLGVIDLRTRGTRLIGQGGPVVGVYRGHVLCVTADGTLRALPFDEERLALSGDPIPLVPNVAVEQAVTQAALADDGTLIYSAALSQESQLVWVDREGRESPLNPELARAFDAVAISPAGDRVAVSIVDADGTGAIWVYDVAAQTLSRLTRDGALSYRPAWAPDGLRIVFASDRQSQDGVRQLWVQPAGGADSATLLVPSRRHAQEITWTKGGDWIAYRDGYDDGGTLRDIRYRRLGSDTTTHAYAATNADEQNPALSPDARWLAYVSNESGRDEVYVGAFPGPGTRTQISSAGGTGPIWGRSGREIFYRSLDGQMVAVDVSVSGPRISPLNRRVLFSVAPYRHDRTHPAYDVAADGRFLVIKPPAASGMEVVLNWLREVEPRLARRP
ncbi:MAG TPA: protein kinase [Gemmatimonadaceae bacterium]|nr:protein kinase [Gemmatimonadaceae bacterium]